MKKFLFWQISTTIVNLVVYLFYLLVGYGPNHAVYCSMVGAVLFSVVYSIVFKVELIPTFTTSIRFATVHTVAASLVIASIALFVANACQATQMVALTVFFFVFLLALVIIIEAAILTIVFVLIFAIAFGIPHYAAMVMFGLSFAFALALARGGSKLKHGWMIFSSILQALATYFIFVHAEKLIHLKHLR